MIRPPTFFFVLFATTLVAPAFAEKPPNILFAFADDWGRHASIYAEVDGPGTLNDAIRTPNFDAIAKSGVLFNNAFVSSPSCTPCRSAILAGQHFWRTRSGSILAGVWDDSLPSWPVLLEKDGYQVGYTWKAWGPGKNAEAPLGGRKNAYRTKGDNFNGFSQTVTRLVGQGMTVDDAKERMAEQVRRNIRNMLRDREADQPFAYWFGPTNVHRKWVRGSGKALWGVDPDSLKGKMPPFLPDVPTVREDFSDYLGEAMAFDLALGILVDELKQAGEYENTIIAISGDHGPAGFPHGKCNLYDFGSRVSLAVSGPGVRGGRVVEDLVSLPDLAATFLEAAGVEVPEEMTSRSLWPTLKAEGTGLVDETRTRVFLGRERHVGTARAGRLPYPQRAIRTPDHLFVINFRPDRYPLGDPNRLDTDNEPTFEELAQRTTVTLADEDAGPTKAWLVTNRRDPDVKPFFDHAYGKRPREELYDLRTDPHQMNNLATDPRSRKIVDQLREELMRELSSTGDPRLIDNGRYYETPPMAGETGR